MSDTPLYPSLAYSAGPERVTAMGRGVIAAAAEALWALSKELDHTFSEAVDLIRRTRGHVCVCGLGKSGQIARKIASTLSATGTPAYFLHASEAVHGDLGMLHTDDTILILSNSGDTREIGAIVDYAELHDIPMVAITSSLSSRLADAAQICLLLPDRPESCPHGSSPTTSTTMMLALGDALAISVMKTKHVTAGALRSLHPGGRLGLDLVTVDSFMHRGDDLPLVAGGDPMSAVIEVMGRKGFGIAAVVDHTGNLEGVITDGDIRRHAATLGQATAQTVMTRNPHVLGSEMLARDALKLLSHAAITSLLVVEDEEQQRVAGLVHIHDLLRLGIG